MLPESTAHAVALTLWDQPLNLDVLEYAAVAYHQDNGSISPPSSRTYDPTGSNFVDWLNRFEVDASYRQFTAQLRLDTDLYFNAPVAAPGATRLQNLLLNRYADRADLEKVNVGYSSRHFDLTVGDSYVSFGRGLVLSMRRLDELAIDTSLRGVNAVGRFEGLTVNGVGGVSNVMNVDPQTGREANDPDDLIYGGHAEYRFGKYVVPSVNAAQIRFNNGDAAPGIGSTLQSEVNAPSRRTTNASMALELPYLFGYGSAYFELAHQWRYYGPSRVARPGFYGSAPATVGPLTALVEYKDYRDYQPVTTSLQPSLYPELALSDFYTAPPTLERLTQEVLDNTNVSGPRARLDVTVTPNIVPFASMAEFQNHVYDTTAIDPYGGIELHWQNGRSRALFSGGYRSERYNDSVAQKELVGRVFQDTTHFEYDINQSLVGPYSIELDGLHASHYDYSTTHYNLWHEGQAYLSLKRADHWSVAAGYEYFTESPALTLSNYVNSSVSYVVVPGVLVRLFAGGQRAGIKCVNGVCRNYPAFDGVRAEIVAKY